MNKDFTAAWQKPLSKQEWDNFLRHNFYSPDRLAVYNIIKNHTIERGKIMSFLEIGFGQCHDFENCFKALHDRKRIAYTGLDITEQFVDYARKKYSRYFFICGGFEDAIYRCDITYTAKTLEHQPPEDYQRCLEYMLNATNELCVINWFITPKKTERMFWNEKQQAWTNAYCKEKIAHIINSCGFQYADITITPERHIYVMTKKG